MPAERCGRPSVVLGGVIAWRFWAQLVFIDGLLQVLPAGASSLSLRSPEIATYTYNVLCTQNHCINPVFPATTEFGRSVFATQENRTWKCASSHNSWRSSGFCSKIVSAYHFALPDGGPEVTEEELLQEQSRQAMRAYVTHVTGMGRDFWRLTEPWEHDDCIQAVWKMSCYAHFPRCNYISAGQYLRPCASTCQNYLKACQVRCCDEGVQCVFSHRREMPDGTVEQEDGFAPEVGPALGCTGAAVGLRKATTWLWLYPVMSMLLALPGERSSAV